ncbi:unnamed protein product, partial [Discosporangium mesarthrocarpum]
DDGSRGGWCSDRWVGQGGPQHTHASSPGCGPVYGAPSMGRGRLPGGRVRNPLQHLPRPRRHVPSFPRGSLQRGGGRG